MPDPFEQLPFRPLPPYRPVTPLKSRDQIQRAHDMLHTVLMGEVSGLEAPPEMQDRLLATLQTLCWILGCPETGDTFDRNLARIDEQLKKLGYKVYRPEAQ